MLAESAGEIELVGKSAFLRDFLDGKRGVLQHFQGEFKAHLRQIPNRRGIQAMLELPLERTASAMCGIADFGQFHFLGEMLADERDRQLQFLGVRLLNRAMGKQEKHLVDLRTVFTDTVRILLLGHCP